MAKQKRDYDALAKTIIENVGGPSNINGFRHCITRVRFRLKDESLAHDDVLKHTDGVIDVVKSGGEYMVVIGSAVEDVYDAVAKQLDGAVNQPSDDAAPTDAKKQNPFMRVLNVVMGCILPALNMICAGGILKGLLSLASIVGWIPADSGLYAVLNATGDAVFYFLPVIIGYNYFKQFNSDGFVGMIIGAILCYPTITATELTLFGITNTTTYTTSVLPVILICAVALPLYRALKKHLPRTVSGFGAPAITLLVVMPLGIAFIGPFATLLGNLVNTGITALMTSVPLVGGAVFGGLYQILVLFGIHSAVTSFAFMNILAGNPDPIMAVGVLVSFSQIGAVLAVMLKTKSPKLKEVAAPAFISGVFGVTEPAIYGVTLPRIKTFVISCIGGAVTGAILMVTNSLLYTFTGLGVFALIGFVNPAAPNLLWPIVATIAGFVFSFVLTFALYKDEGEDLTDARTALAAEDVDGTGSAVAEKNSDAAKADAKPAPVAKTVIEAPVPGEVVDLSQVPDPAFSSGAMGHGFAVKPSQGKVYAPFDGTASVVFPTGHALGLVSNTGVELLIHVGMDTVNLNGKGFTTHVKQGDHITKGELLIDFDIPTIEAAGLSTTVPVIVTNEADTGDAQVDLAAGTITIGE